jgi:precorrin-6B methylase 2
METVQAGRIWGMGWGRLVMSFVSEDVLWESSRKLTEHRRRTEMEKVEEGQEDRDLGEDRWKPAKPEG